jgi:hypothetical protein
MPSAKVNTPPAVRQTRIGARISGLLDKPENSILLAICVIALILRLPQLGASFYGDEQFSLLRDSSTLITNSEDRFRPLFFSLLYLWRQMGFHGEIGLRLLPLLFGLIQIPVAWYVGLRLAGKRLARVFAVLIAASPLLIEFSQELRMYSMVALIGLLQVLVYLRLLEKPSLIRWPMFVLVAVIGVYTHLHYWLFLTGFAVVFLIERRQYPLWKGWGALAATLVLYLPDYWNIQRFIAVRSGEYAVHLASAVPKLLAAFTIGFNYAVLGEEGAGRPVGLADVLHNLPILLLAALPAIIIAWALIRAHFRKPFPRTLMLGHALFTVPILLAFIACVVTHKYWLQPKYVIFSAPFALLLIAESYLALSPAILRRATAALGIAVCAIALIHFWTPTEYGRREDWRGAAYSLRARINGDTRLVLLGKDYSYMLLTYYWPEVQKKWSLVDVPENLSKPSREFDESLRDQLQTRGWQHVYYLWSDIRRNESDPHDVLLQAVKYLGGNAVDSIRYNPRLVLYHVRVAFLSHDTYMSSP